MRKSNYSTPELNAGSMADIAFLLLIFFLVTTTMSSDHGFQRVLPAWDDGSSSPVPEREVLVVHLNGGGQLLVNDEIKQMADLPKLVYDFFSNREGREDRPRMKVVHAEGVAEYRALAGKGMVFLKFQQSVPYENYIQIQDGLMAGYGMLWEDVTQTVAQRPYKELNKQIDADAQLMKRAREAFPPRIAEEPVL